MHRLKNVLTTALTTIKESIQSFLSWSTFQLITQTLGIKKPSVVSSYKPTRLGFSMTKKLT